MVSNLTLRTLQFLNLVVFALGVLVVISLHIYTKDFFDFLRMPVFLKNIDGFLGHAWPASLHVYQTVLLLSLFLAAINACGLFLYKVKYWKYVSDVSSFLGFLIIWPVTLFFIFTLLTADNLSEANVQTIYTYFAFTLFIFILDLVTWYFDEKSLLRTNVAKGVRRR